MAGRWAILLLVTMLAGAEPAVVPSWGEPDEAPPVAEDWPAAPAAIQVDIPLPFEPYGATIPRIALRHSEDGGVGYPDGFTAIEGFLPCSPDGLGDTVCYLDARGIIANDGRLSSNLGGGYRLGDRAQNLVWGCYGFWDTRDSGRFSYQQLSPGIEVLGECCEFRANGYIPIGPQNRLALNAGSVQCYESAMNGFDVEIGCAVPVLESLDPRVYLGYYHFDADASPCTDGVRVRLQFLVGDNVAVNLAYSNDPLFANTLTAALVWRWPQGFRASGQPGRRLAGERLHEPVERNHQIVVTEGCWP